MTRTTRALALGVAGLTLGACADGALPTAPDTAPRASHSTDPCAHDATAPTITSVSATPSQLWPPNHKMVTVQVSMAATDDCSSVTNSIVGVTSNEPVNGLGDGNTAPDWVVTGPLTLQLRSERSGLGSGRVYTIFLQSTDASGNSASTTTTVFVPHDQGRGRGGR